MVSLSISRNMNDRRVLTFVCAVRVFRLPGLSHVELRADSGTCGWAGGYSECLYDVGASDGYFRFRHLAYWAGEED